MWGNRYMWEGRVWYAYGLCPDCCKRAMCPNCRLLGESWQGFCPACPGSRTQQSEPGPLSKVFLFVATVLGERIFGEASEAPSDEKDGKPTQQTTRATVPIATPPVKEVKNTERLGSHMIMGGCFVGSWKVLSTLIGGTLVLLLFVRELGGAVLVGASAAFYWFINFEKDAGAFDEGTVASTNAVTSLIAKYHSLPEWPRLFIAAGIGIFLGLLIFGSGHVLIFFYIPVLLGVTVVVGRSSTVVSWLDKFDNWLIETRKQADEATDYTSRFVTKPLFVGLTKIMEWSQQIRDQALCSGVKVTSYLWFFTLPLWAAFAVSPYLFGIIGGMFLIWLFVTVFGGFDSKKR